MRSTQLKKLEDQSSHEMRVGERDLAFSVLCTRSKANEISYLLYIKICTVRTHALPGEAEGVSRVKGAPEKKKLGTENVRMLGRRSQTQENLLGIERDKGKIYIRRDCTLYVSLG